MADAVSGYALGDRIPYTNTVTSIDGVAADSLTSKTFYATVRLASGDKSVMWSGTDADSNFSVSIVDGKTYIEIHVYTYDQTPAYAAGTEYAMDVWVEDTSGTPTAPRQIDAITFTLTEPQTQTFS